MLHYLFITIFDTGKQFYLRNDNFLINWKSVNFAGYFLPEGILAFCFNFDILAGKYI